MDNRFCANRIEEDGNLLLRNRIRDDIRNFWSSTNELYGPPPESNSRPPVPPVTR